LQPKVIYFFNGLDTKVEFFSIPASESASSPLKNV